MIRAFFVEFVFPILLFLFVRSLLGNFITRFRTPPMARPPAVPVVQAGGELKKDPVCGTYVSTATGLTRSVGGQIVYFCSKACRDQYPKA